MGKVHNWDEPIFSPKRMYDGIMFHLWMMFGEGQIPPKYSLWENAWWHRRPYAKAKWKGEL
jgi:hypothetical protein